MSDSFAVLSRGTVYVENGSIAAVQDAAQPAPADFAGVTPIETQGTIYPGLIELHNHLSYNALRLWNVPRDYGDRSQWAGTPQYQQLITEPMKVLGTLPGLPAAVVRYVECKCLLAGVTSSQGIELFSDAGVRRYYRGTLRVVESPNDPALPPAGTKIADVVAADRAAFLKELGSRKCFLLHLSEGVDDAARQHFTSLQFPDGSWAITSSLAGIHCVALKQPDWQVLASHGASMVWSPLSNLLLYGGTADVVSARNAGIQIGIGSDWAPSGSKNLLGELKVARIYAQNSGIGFSDRDLVAMATREAAAILRWDHLLGSIEAGKRADLIVTDAPDGDPYGALLDGTEASVRLVMINGAARLGDPGLMQSLGISGEAVPVGQQTRILDLQQAAEDPAVGALSLSEAEQRLADALHRLPELVDQVPAQTLAAAGDTTTASEHPTWFLALDELSDTGMDVRPRLTSLDLRPTIPGVDEAPLPVQPLQLDALTVVDDADFLARLAAEKNLPAYLVPALREAY